MAEKQYGACEVCWTISWAPVPTEAECALAHPHEGEHVMCEYCHLLRNYEQVVAKLARIHELLRASTFPQNLLEPIIELTAEPYAER